MLQHFSETRMRIVHHLNRRVDHLGQIVRRDICSHAHRDTIRSVHDQVGKARRQHGGLKRRLVIVRDEVHRLHFDVVQHLPGNARHAALRVTHRRRRVAVHRAKVALSVNHRIAQTEGLRQPHHRVINRRVAVRMVNSHRLTHDLGAFRVLFVMLQSHLMHREENAAMDGLETVAHIGQSAANND